MPLSEIMKSLFRWMCDVPWSWRPGKTGGAGEMDRHTLELGGIPAEIEAKELKITIGRRRRRRRR